MEAPANGAGGGSQGAEDEKGQSLHPGQEECRKGIKHTFLLYSFPFSGWLGLLIFHTGKQIVIFCSRNGPSVGKVAVLGLYCSFPRPQE